MGTANRCKALLAFVCLAIPCLAPAQSAAPEGRFRASGTGLVFPVPPGLVAHARPILADGDPRGGSLVVVDLAPEGVPPARAGLLAQVTITMRELPRAAVLRDLVEQPPGCAPEPFTEESAVVAGAPAVRRDSPSFRQYLVVRGRREYRFSAGPAEEHRKALAHVLDGLTFDDSPTGEAFPSADAAPLPQGAGVPEVRAVYLVPSNRVLEPGYRLGIEKAMRQVQAFYRSELGGRTFRLHDPVVEVVRTPHTVSWYQSQAPAADPVYRFWNGVTSDGFSLMGAQFNDPDDRWLFLIDADPLCGQVGGAGTQGVAVVPKNDSRNLLCESLVSACPGDQQFPGICVSTGGIGHEIGHAFNLPHPSPGSCPAPDTSCSSALMWTGYLAYPDAYFLDDDRTSLVNSPETAAFFSFFDPGPVPFSCGDGCAPPRPTNLAAGGGGPSVDLTWDASPGAESYSLYRRGPGSGGLYALAANGLPSNAHVDAVPGGQTYSYLVTAVSALGESGNSSPATATLPANVLSVADVTVVEGDSGTTEAAITISLSPVSAVPVSVGVATAAGTAAPGLDYENASGVVSIPAGASGATFLVPLHGDRIDEGDETVEVRLDSPVGATIGRAVATLTVQDDDQSGLSIDDVTLNEGALAMSATFTVSLVPANAQTVTVDYATRDGSAVAPGDYASASGTLTFPPGATTQTVTVTVNPDAEAEGDEAFYLDLLLPSGGVPLVAPGYGTGRIVERGFFAVAPCRVVDTRDAPGPLGGPALAGAEVRTFPIGGHCGIPANARAVVLNMTVTNAQATGHLRLFAADAPSVPLVSAINYAPDLTRANNAIVALSAAGSLSVGCYQAEGTVDVILDVSGYLR